MHVVDSDAAVAVGVLRPDLTCEVPRIVQNLVECALTETKPVVDLQCSAKFDHGLQARVQSVNEEYIGPLIVVDDDELVLIAGEAKATRHPPALTGVAHLSAEVCNRALGGVREFHLSAQGEHPKLEHVAVTVKVDFAPQLGHVQLDAVLLQPVHEHAGPRDQARDSIDILVYDPRDVTAGKRLEDLGEVVAVVEVRLPAEVEHRQDDSRLSPSRIAIAQDGIDL